MKNLLPLKLNYWTKGSLIKKAESNTNYEQEVQEHDLYDALMARTNIPEKTTSNTDYSRVLMHKDDLKGLVCIHFSGTPNSCKYG